MAVQLLSATIGTLAFAMLFGAPRQYYPFCALIGGAGWGAYLLCSCFFSEEPSCLIATMAVVLLSRFAAIRERCPVTVFLITGIFPLVPGAGVYWTAYYLVTNQLALASDTGYQAVKNAAAIVLGIVFVFEIPQSLFLKILRRRKA